MRKVYTKIDQISGSVIRLKATNVGFDDIAVVESDRGTSLAQVIRLQNDNVYLQLFAGTKGVSTGDRVRFLGHPMQVSFSDNLLGRIFCGNGNPRDGKAPLSDNLIAIDGPSVNPARREMPRNMIRTGIPMIDLFNTLVESQKLPIFSIPGEPYNALLARIALQAEADIIVFGGMGLKYDDYLFFKNTFEEGGVLPRSIMFVHTASDPVVECLLVPDMALAVAENFAVQQNKKSTCIANRYDIICRCIKRNFYYHGTNS